MFLQMPYVNATAARRTLYIPSNILLSSQRRYDFCRNGFGFVKGLRAEKTPQISLSRSRPVSQVRDKNPTRREIRLKILTFIERHAVVIVHLDEGAHRHLVDVIGVFSVLALHHGPLPPSVADLAVAAQRL